MKIRNNDQLINSLSNGEEFNYLFFWGHQTNKKQINKTCFSQWYEYPFEENNIQYLTAEHYMMHKKALLFNDSMAAKKVLNAKTAAIAKKIGREIINFSEDEWLAHRFDIVVNANLAKFTSKTELKEFLINTCDTILVEASPVDKIWGIGMASDNPYVGTPTKWKGLNLLGYALMEVRDQLKRNLVK